MQIKKTTNIPQFSGLFMYETIEKKNLTPA